MDLSDVVESQNVKDFAREVGVSLVKKLVFVNLYSAWEQ